MTKAAAKTGVSPTVLVAIEQHFPEKQRIIEDHFACRILPFGMKIFVWLMRPDWIRSWMTHVTEKNSPGIWGSILCRKRYINERVIYSSNQIEGVANVGAGFDTLVYRLPELSDIAVWEVDLPENIKAKQIQLLKVFGAIPTHIKLVAMDLDLEDLGTTLQLQGYSTHKRTFFVLEAVTQYLTEKGIMKTFDFLAKAARGSRLVFTYIRKDFLDGRVMYGEEKLYKKYVAEDKIWLFGIDPESVPDFLKECGWQIIEDISYDELAEKYIKPTGRILSSTSIERIVYAEKL